MLKYNSVNVFLQSLFWFLAFLNLEIKNVFFNRTIIKIAPLTFAVYLIHESLGFKVYLWQIINTNVTFLDNTIYFLIEIGIALAIFIICIVIEWLRQKLFKFIKFDKALNRLSQVIYCKVINLL